MVYCFMWEKEPWWHLEMDHVARVQRGPDLKWKQPAWIDKIKLQAESIIECGFDGEWDTLQEENMTFTLWNHAYISNLVKTMFTWEFELFYIMAQFWHFFAPFFMVWMMPGSLITSECSWAVWVILEAHMHQQYSQLWEFCGLIHFKCTIFRLWAPICFTFEISWLNWLTNQYFQFIWSILKLKNQSGFQGFCGPIKIYKFQDLQRILKILPFFCFIDNLSQKWCLRSILYIQPINVSEPSEVNLWSNYS